MFLLLSLPCSLSQINKHILGWGWKNIFFEKEKETAEGTSPHPQWAHNREVLWAYGEMATSYNPERALTLLTPWPWTSSLQNCKKINFCCLSHLVYGILLGQPKLGKKTKILSKSLLKRNNRPQMESLLLSLLSPNQDLIPHLIAVSASRSNIILTGQSRITRSALLLDPICPLKEGDLAWNNPLFLLCL